MDDKLSRTRPVSTLLDMKTAARQPVGETPGETEIGSPASDDFASLPQPGSAYDAAYSRASNKPVPTIHFVIGDSILGLPYANLDSIDWLVPDKPGASPAIVMRFTGLIPREAIINGRNMLRMYDLLSHHRVAWVRELPKGRDFKDNAATVVTGIAVNRIKEIPA
jgi:hypothetical protein